LIIPLIIPGGDTCDKCNGHQSIDHCCEDKKCLWKEYQDCATMSENDCGIADHCSWYTSDALLCTNINEKKACCSTDGCSYYGDELCWPTTAPIPSGFTGKDLCCDKSQCEPVVRDCNCYNSCEIQVKGSIQFAFDCPGGNKCDLEEQKTIDCQQNIPIVEDVASILNQYDGTSNTNRVEIELHGHTDAAGNDNYNLQLSAKRVLYVQWLLSTKVQLNDIKQVVGIKGYGEKCLKIKDKDANQENRRVDFWRSTPDSCLNNPGVSVDDVTSSSENCKLRCETNKEDGTIDSSNCDPQIVTINDFSNLGKLWEDECPGKTGKSESTNINLATTDDDDHELELDEGEGDFMNQEASKMKFIEVIEKTGASGGSGGNTGEQPGSIIGTRCGGQCYGEWEPRSCTEICIEAHNSGQLAQQVSTLEECKDEGPSATGSDEDIKDDNEDLNEEEEDINDKNIVVNLDDPKLTCKTRDNCPEGTPESCMNEVWCLCNTVKKDSKGKVKTSSLKFTTTKQGCDSKRQHGSPPGSPPICIWNDEKSKCDKISNAKKDTEEAHCDSETEFLCNAYCPVDKAALSAMEGNPEKRTVACGSGVRGQIVRVTLMEDRTEHCAKPDLFLNKNVNVAPGDSCKPKGGGNCGTGIFHKPRYFKQGEKEYCCKADVDCNQCSDCRGGSGSTSSLSTEELGKELDCAGFASSAETCCEQDGCGFSGVACLKLQQIEDNGNKNTCDTTEQENVEGVTENIVKERGSKYCKSDSRLDQNGCEATLTQDGSECEWVADTTTNKGDCRAVK
jgi:hypothetical protein